MPRTSAGILMYRYTDDIVEVLLVHPGGPFWRNKDAGAWSIPKGEFAPGDDPQATAIREFNEETGGTIVGELTPLKPVKQSGGKIVHAFAVEGDFDTDTLVSNTFLMELPPKSGKMVEVPEVDRAEWFDLRTAREKINAAQTAFLDELQDGLGIAIRQ